MVTGARGLWVQEKYHHGHRSQGTLGTQKKSPWSQEPGDSKCTRTMVTGAGGTLIHRTIPPTEERFNFLHRVTLNQQPACWDQDARILYFLEISGSKGLWYQHDLTGVGSTTSIFRGGQIWATSASMHVCWCLLHGITTTLIDALKELARLQLSDQITTP